MTFVINDKCIGSVDTSCIEVCPVNCIYAVGEDPEEDGPLLLVINPEECIDCGQCVPECPVEAITSEDKVPEKFAEFTEINAMITGRTDMDGPAEEDAYAHTDIAERALTAHKQIRGVEA
jgi:NAD-dependent dihydropyrimidine dehydrogenase PreA subunit